MPTVSIIVPARNEEACLRACLESLVAQDGVESEIIVVDDASSDGTAQIASAFPVRVVPAGPLAAGLSGKCNAAQSGADAAGGEWLLFTDADTVHAPGSLARALGEAREQKVDLLSYSPRQEVHGLLERAVMAVIFAELASTFRPQEVCDPRSPAAAANGQYLLITRAAYDAIGGHRAVAQTLLEDVAMAEKVKRSGRAIRFRYAGEQLRTRMYRSFAALWEGWTKNLALLFPDTMQLAARRGIEFLAALAGVTAAVAGLALHQGLLAGAGLLIAAPT